MLSSIKAAYNRLFGKRTAGENTYQPVPAEQLRLYNASREGGSQPMLCYAPFKSLYFRHGGKVVACCYNRQYILGNYPEMSIEEIWFGQAADKLRKYVANNDLSLGCFGCENLMRAGNFDAIKTKMYDSYKANKNKYPSVMEFELSNTCNLECIMCSGEFSSSIRKNRDHKPPLPNVYDAAFVQQLEAFIPWLDEVKFYGGEPFLIEVYYEIWEKIAALNPSCRISVQTNATTLNNRVKKLLDGGNFHLNISLDSVESSNYERIRINAKFDRVMENIRYFRDYTRARDTFFGISACVMRDNWKELPKFIDFCNELDAPIYFHTVYFPVERALWNLDAAQLQEICSYLEGFDFPGETPVQQKNKMHYADTLKLIRQWQGDAEKHAQTLADFEADATATDPLQVLYFQLRDYVYHAEDIEDKDKEKKLSGYFSKVTNLLKLLPENYPLEKVLGQVHAIGIDQLALALDENQEDKLLSQAMDLTAENQLQA